MKSKLAQIMFHVNKFNPYQFKAVYFVLVLAASIIMRVPSDGGGGPV